MSPQCVTFGLHLTHFPGQAEDGCCAVTALLYVTCTCEHPPLASRTHYLPEGLLCLSYLQAVARPATALSLHRFAVRRLPANPTLQPTPLRPRFAQQGAVLRQQLVSCSSLFLFLQT